MASEFVEAIYVVFASTMSYLITNIIIKLTSVESIKKKIFNDVLKSVLQNNTELGAQPQL